MWLDPRPVAEDISKLYSDQYFTHTAPNEASGSLAVLKKGIKQSILAATFGYQGMAADGTNRAMGWVLSRVGPLRDMAGGKIMWLEASRRGQLLDVGCGSGQFLADMRKLGWEVVGVEPDPEAVRVAREHFGLEVRQGTLEDADFPDDSFDAITVHHVIEHVLDPVGILRECRRVLKPGGKLVVVTPNIESLGHRVFGELWIGLDVPRHLQLFSPRALQTCTERAGFRVVERWTTARAAASWIWAGSGLLCRNGPLPGESPAKKSFWLRLGGLAFQAVEEILCRLTDVGEEPVLIATKDNG